MTILLLSVLTLALGLAGSMAIIYALADSEEQ